MLAVAQVTVAITLLTSLMYLIVQVVLTSVYMHSRTPKSGDRCDTCQSQ